MFAMGLGRNLIKGQQETIYLLNKSPWGHQIKRTGLMPVSFIGHSLCHSWEKHLSESFDFLVEPRYDSLRQGVAVWQ